VYLEMLYETGIEGLLLFGLPTLFHWALRLGAGSVLALQKSAIFMYVFQPVFRRIRLRVSGSVLLRAYGRNHCPEPGR
jgi:hypothetical protein